MGGLKPEIFLYFPLVLGLSQALGSPHPVRTVGWDHQRGLQGTNPTDDGPVVLTRGARGQENPGRIQISAPQCPLQWSRDHLNPPCVPSGAGQSPGRAGRGRAKPSSSLEEQQKLEGPSASSCLHTSKEQECEREKVTSPQFCVSSQALFSSFSIILLPRCSFRSGAFCALLGH